MTSETVARPVTVVDLEDVMALYRALSATPDLPGEDVAVHYLDRILSHPGTTIWGAEADGRIAAMCTVHILPNMTRGGRPYALIENVVSHPERRGEGLARVAMEAAIAAAWEAGCYKVMLLSGSVDGHGFYPRLGFDGDAKRGFVLRRP